MKGMRFLFVLMMASVLPRGTSVAQPTDHPSHQAISQSGEKSADQETNEVRSDKDQARSKQGDESQPEPAVVRRTSVKHRPSAGHPKTVPGHQSRPAKTHTKNNARIEAPGRVALPEKMASKAATSSPNRAVSRRSPSAPSPAVSVNGQQFRNSRDPGAHLAVSGGPLATARGTAAINGTNMKRKP